jgi:hypothetical protein
MLITHMRHVINVITQIECVTYVFGISDLRRVHEHVEHDRGPIDNKIETICHHFRCGYNPGAYLKSAKKGLGTRESAGHSRKLSDAFHSHAARGERYAYGVLINLRESYITAEQATLPMVGPPEVRVRRWENFEESGLRQQTQIVLIESLKHVIDHCYTRLTPAASCSSTARRASLRALLRA